MPPGCGPRAKPAGEPAPGTVPGAAPGTVPGLVVTAWNEWFGVVPLAGGDASKPVPCRPRGRLKREGVVVGDRVSMSPLPDGEGAIESVAPRRNRLRRPPVSNVDRVFVVMAWRRPDHSPELLDRILVQAWHAGVEAVVVMNKVDLAEGPREREAISAWRSVYEAAGYEAHAVSARTGENVEPLAARMREPGTAILAGPSGSGKSLLLSRAAPGARLRSAGVSERTGRGRHTTRHVTLLPVGEGWVADTPGFSRLDLPEVEPRELGEAFGEFAPLAGGCRFNDCLHRSEPGCAVLAAVAEGRVDAGRHRRYVQFLAELQTGGRVR